MVLISDEDIDKFNTPISNKLNTPAESNVPVSAPKTEPTIGRLPTMGILSALPLEAIKLLRLIFAP